VEFALWRIGSFAETVSIHSEGGMASPQKVVIRGAIVRGIELIREPVESVTPSQARPLRFTLRGSTDLGAWTVEGLRTWPDGAHEEEAEIAFRVDRLPDSPEAGVAYRVEADLEPAEVPGHRRTWVRVRTSLGASMSLTAAFAHEVFAAVRPSMNPLHLGVVAAERIHSARVRLLRANDEIHFAVREVGVVRTDRPDSDPEFEAAAGTDDIGAFVDVRFVGRYEGGRRLAARLRIETDRPDCPTIEVPILGVIPLESSGVAAPGQPAR
jgi:hypothetical protein